MLKKIHGKLAHRNRKFHMSFVTLVPFATRTLKAGLDLFEMTWDQFVLTSSRLSAEPLERRERERLLERVSVHGFVNDYRYEWSIINVRKE